MKKKAFIPGETYIPVSGKVFDSREVNNAIQAAKDGWWTEGHFVEEFERDFKKFLGVNYVSLVNSGSSANLVAVATLTSSVFGSKRLMPGDEVITTNVAFPTTVNPLVLYNLKPVFVDAEYNNINIDVSLIEKAITKKTKMIMFAHTLGIPTDVEKIAAIAKKHDLWFIEDCCDALGSRYKNKLVGTFGHMATYSFYPAHQITMGEGGAVVTNSSLIYKANRQFRDWGRDCWCDTGKDNTCRKRFEWQLGDLPYGYDHKYIYSQIGYNLKLTDFQAGIGVAQLKKLPVFIEKRKANYKELYAFFQTHSQFFDLIETPKHADPCWFGFPAYVRDGAPFTRNEFTQYLEKHQVGTRNIFSGNLLRHPAYSHRNFKVIKKNRKQNADLVLNNAFWLGVFPGIDKQRLAYMKKIINQFLAQYIKK
jgi:CDP-4-dehydro-6-deoxyglucose reductase, E1